MGCTASRPAFDDELLPEQQPQLHDGYYPSLSRGISMPGPLYSHNPSLHDFNIVPLSPSTYGINMKVAELDGQKVFGHGDAKKEDSMKEMLQVLESLDMGGVIGDASAPPSIFDDLKPGLEKHFNQALGKPIKAEPIVSRPVQGKENAKPPPLSPSIGPNSPVRQKGSASPKPSRSKSSFASRFLKRSSSAVASQKSEEPTADQDASVQARARKSEAGGSIFDADLLASYESALKELTQDDWNALKDDTDQRQQSVDFTKDEDEEMVHAQPQREIPTPVKKKREDPLEKYEKLCPPRGENGVVLYTTSLRGIRKTFEDCNSLRSVLESFQVSVDERDVAMHQGFRNELREMMGNKPVPVPRLFVKGRYIGGAEDVLQLHEEEQLAPLLQDVPWDHRGGSAQPCDGCGGARFVPCMDCSGSRKVVDPDNPREVIRCPDCNENGLIQCPICS